MWWTQDGARVLQGAEAKLFKEALGTIVDMVQDDDEEGLWQFDAPPFDILRPNQKLAVLAQVGTAPLHENVPMPRLTAVCHDQAAGIQPQSQTRQPRSHRTCHAAQYAVRDS